LGTVRIRIRRPSSRRSSGAALVEFGHPLGPIGRIAHQVT
jgi:hypothetical protein